MVMTGAGMAKQGILSLSITGAPQLHRLYMPYVNNGGMFVPTVKNYKLGDDVFLLLSLDDEEKLPVTGKVIWITPAGCQGSRTQGVGIQFSDSADMNKIRTKIETMLAPYKGDEIQTETM